VRPRHTDTDLLELAHEGSAPAFASLLHRHRDVIQRGALRAEHPERVAESTMVAAVRELRRGRASASDPRGWLDTLVEEQVLRDPGSAGIDRMLPGDWFDRAWVRAERCWPSGRRPLRVPRWAGNIVGALLLALAGGGTAYLVITADPTVEVISELVAEPIEDPEVLVVPGPVVEAEPEEAPELFGDVELGELPTYDLIGEDGERPPDGPTLGPPATSGPEDDGSAGSDDAGADDGGADDGEG
jgi:hypothetical protein